MAQPMTSEQRKQIVRLFEDGLDVLKLDKEQAQILATSGGEFQKEIQNTVLNFVTEEQKYKLARAILGNDFISPEEVAKARGIVYSNDQLQHFIKTLPDVKVLQSLRDNNYMLLTGPVSPLALLDVRTMKPAYFYRKEGGWYADDEQKFSRDDKAPVSWLALRKDAVPGSFGENWSTQTALLRADEYVPNAGEATWGFTTYYAVRGTYLLPNFYVRTISLDSAGYRVLVGYFDRNGLHVDGCLVGDAYGNLGLASARKL